MHAVKKSLTGRIVFDIILLALETVASVAQPVVQLIRNQQVACSSHVTSSIYKIPLNILFSGIFLFCKADLVIIRRWLCCRMPHILALIFTNGLHSFLADLFYFTTINFFGGVVLKILIVRYIINSKINRNFFIRKAVIK